MARRARTGPRRTASATRDGVGIRAVFGAAGECVGALTVSAEIAARRRTGHGGGARDAVAVRAEGDRRARRLRCTLRRSGRARQPRAARVGSRPRRRGVISGGARLPRNSAKAAACDTGRRCIARRPRACRASHRQPDTLEGRHHERRAHRHLVFRFRFAVRLPAAGTIRPVAGRRRVRAAAHRARRTTRPLGPESAGRDRGETRLHLSPRAISRGQARHCIPDAARAPVQSDQAAAPRDRDGQFSRRDPADLPAYLARRWTCRRRKASPRCAKRSIFRKA